MNVGLIAHNGKKKLMQNFCIAYSEILSKHNLYATETTGRLVNDVTDLRIHTYLAGNLGGTQQMAARISENKLDMVIFFRDPEHADKHEPNVNNIVKLCDTYNIPMATNIATAELFIRALENGDLEWREHE